MCFVFFCCVVFASYLTQPLLHFAIPSFPFPFSEFTFLSFFSSPRDLISLSLSLVTRQFLRQSVQQLRRRSVHFPRPSVGRLVCLCLFFFFVCFLSGILPTKSKSDESRPAPSFFLSRSVLLIGGYEVLVQPDLYCCKFGLLSRWSSSPTLFLYFFFFFIVIIFDLLFFFGIVLFSLLFSRTVWLVLLIT